jgi:hypothetical protein
MGLEEIFRVADNFSKIKCNRLRPTCEACQVFQCPCIYGAQSLIRGRAQL